MGATKTILVLPKTKGSRKALVGILGKACK